MQFQMVKTAALTPSPLNPRKHFDQARLEELAASMGHEVGLIEPIVARAGRTPETFEIIAGERRWKAAQLATLDEVPVIVKVLTDKQVIDLMLIENGQREDLNPLEEGEGYKRALKIGAFKDVDALAAHVGKSRRHVYDTLKLVDDLVPEAKTLLGQGVLTASHGVLLSRLTPEQQAAAVNPDYFDLGGVFRNGDEDDVDDEVGRLSPEAINNRRKKEPGFGLRVVPVREFGAWINRNCRLDVGDRRVQEQFPQLKAVVAKAATVVHITNEYWLDGDVKREAGAARVYTSNEWKRATGGKGQAICDARVMGVVVLGPGRGDAFEVCVDKKCDVHWKEERRGHERAPKASPSATSKTSQASWQQQQRKAQEKEDALKKAWVAAVPKLLEACAANVKGLSLAALTKALVPEHQRSLFKSAAALLPDAKDAETALRTFVLMTFVRDVKENYGFNRDRFAESAKAQLGLDIGPLLKSVQASAPPKQGPTKAKVKAKATKKKPAAAAKAKKAKKAVKPKKAIAGAKKSGASKKAAAA